MDNIGILKKKIDSKEIAVGTCISSSDSCITEMLGYAGYDILWIDTEHTAIDKKDLLLNLIAAQASGVPAFVRVPWNDPVLIKPVLEMGPDGIIIPLIKTAEDARNAVKACTYPPEGIRGYGPIRSIRYGIADNMEYIREAKQKFWKIVQIEHIDAVENIEEILSVEGIDGIMVGPNDLSGSIGLLGQTDHPDVKRLMDRIGEAVVKTSKYFGVAMGYNQKAIEEWFKRGVQWFIIGGDYGYLKASAINTLENTKEIFKRLK